jgi:hypothetical protein
MVTLDIHEDDDGVVSWTLSDGGNPDRKPVTLAQGVGDDPARAVPLKEAVEDQGGMKPVEGENLPLKKPKRKRR